MLFGKQWGLANTTHEPYSYHAVYQEIDVRLRRGVEEATTRR